MSFRLKIFKFYVNENSQLRLFMKITEAVARGVVVRPQAESRYDSHVSKDIIYLLLPIIYTLSLFPSSGVCLTCTYIFIQVLLIQIR